MFQLYTPVLLLQAFCLYHAYSRNIETKWYYLILFLPFIGSIIYLVKHFNHPRHIDDLTEKVQTVVNVNYETDKLERASKATDTVANKIRLADEYVRKERFEEAVDLYESCLQGVNDDDLDLVRKLIYALYRVGDYQTAVQFGNQIKGNRFFRNMEERIAYAWSLYHTQKLELAEIEFEGMNNHYSNYEHRKEYARFLSLTDRVEAGRQLLRDLIDEMDDMDRQERRSKRAILQEIKKMLPSL